MLEIHDLVAKQYYMRFSALLLICFLFLQTTLSFSQSGDQKILFITSNQTTYGNTNLPTSNHFAEIVWAYDEFKNAGYEVDFMSPLGGEIPIGYIDSSDRVQKKYLENRRFMNRLKTTLQPSAVSETDYLAVYYSGGGAAMFGVPENEQIQKISENIYNNNGVISAVCHGTAGIVNLKNENGLALYSGMQITGFPDAFERTHKPYYKTFPFSIENEIRANGGVFNYSEKGWDGHYMLDNRIVTGQDPSGSALVAKKVIEIIKKIK